LTILDMDYYEDAPGADATVSPTATAFLGASSSPVVS
jgi:hypothetical protein